MRPAWTRIRGISVGSAAASMIGADCGQPRLIGSLSGPSSIIWTNSSMTKLRSSVVTTSSAPKRSLRSAGPRKNSAPAMRAGDQHQRDHDPRRRVDRAGADRDGGERAGIELALAADVPEPRPEGDGRGKPGEDQRRGAGQRLGEGEERAEGAGHHVAIGVDRVGAGEGDGDGGKRQRRDSRRAPGRRPTRAFDGAGRGSMTITPPSPRHGRPSSGRGCRGRGRRRAAPPRGDRRRSPRCGRRASSARRGPRR